MNFSWWGSVVPQLLTTSNFIGPWYHAALLFSGLGSIVLLFGVLFSQQIREDLVRAATSPLGWGWGWGGVGWGCLRYFRLFVFQMYNLY